MFPKIFQIGGFYLPTYGVMVALGFLVALWITGKLARRSGLDPEKVSNIAVYGALAGLLGAKLLMFVVDFPYYAANPGQILSLATLQAGGVFFGGLICALGAGYWFLRSAALPIAATLDAYAPGLVIGQAIGRIGCFAAGCCWGDLCERPWAVRFTSPEAFELTGVPLNVPVHPSQLYEAVMGLAVFAILYLRFGAVRRPGSVMGLYLVLTGVARFAIEFVRFHAQPNPAGGPLTTAQWISAGLVLLGVWLLVARRDQSSAVTSAT